MAIPMEEHEHHHIDPQQDEGHQAVPHLTEDEHAGHHHVTAAHEAHSGHAVSTPATESEARLSSAQGEHTGHAMEHMHHAPEEHTGTNHHAHQEHEMTEMSHAVGEEHHAGAHVDHTGHENMFRRKFWVSLILSIPVILYSMGLQMMTGISMPAFPGSQWLAPIFAVIVFIYGGLPFLQMAVPELKDR